MNPGKAESLLNRGEMGRKYKESGIPCSAGTKEEVME